MNIPDHPEIISAMRTGYPSWKQEPDELHCERCETELYDDVYEDTTHDYLCLDCLLLLHKRER